MPKDDLSDDRAFYLLDEGRVSGPVGVEAICLGIRSGTIDESWLVQEVGSHGWLRCSQISELAWLFEVPEKHKNRTQPATPRSKRDEEQIVR